jgi:cytidylate kinase
MKADQTATSQMRAITLSREYGSGGGEIATRLAKRLGWQLVDHIVVERVAEQLGVSQEEAEAYDERTESLVSRILNSLQIVQAPMPVTVPVPVTTDSRIYNEARRKVIEGAFATGHVVIVGRGGQALLAQRRDVLHVRVVAPFEMRVSYVMRREGLNQADARTRIQNKDRDRHRYLQAEHRLNPDDAHLYDLVVNTGILDLETAVDLICLALERKARRLSVPTGELGPGAGMTRYPGEPADFRPPETTSGQQA